MSQKEERQDGSAARDFIKNKATKEDLLELLKLTKEKLANANSHPKGGVYMLREFLTLVIAPIIVGVVLKLLLETIKAVNRLVRCFYAIGY
ncbi:hypothetical protein EQ500_01250 [Lactobacillus sp. XV13L]|nr:hypothetical protein [Lactobacillus sp. XV13L]